MQQSNSFQKEEIREEQITIHASIALEKEKKRKKNPFKFPVVDNISFELLDWMQKNSTCR